MKVDAAQRLAYDQGELDLGLEPVTVPEPLPITSTKMSHLWEALSRAYDALGFDDAAGGDEVFHPLVVSQIIEPTSELDAL